MRSPNYGKKTRPAHKRLVFVTGVEQDEDGSVQITMEGPKQRAFSFPAEDYGSAVTKVELIRQGAYSLPI